ncbi:MAG: hypothetical protein WKF58_08125 [Ilumatobacteraceae bacterium]
MRHQQVGVGCHTPGTTGRHRTHTRQQIDRILTCARRGELSGPGGERSVEMGDMSACTTQPISHGTDTVRVEDPDIDTAQQVDGCVDQTARLFAVHGQQLNHTGVTPTTLRALTE